MWDVCMNKPWAGSLFRGWKEATDMLHAAVFDMEKAKVITEVQLQKWKQVSYIPHRGVLLTAQPLGH